MNDQPANKLRDRLLAIIPWVLGLMTISVLLSEFPDADLGNTYAAEIILYGVLTLFVLFFGVWLSESELSPAHAVGMVAFLSVNIEAIAWMTWAIAIGGALGAVVLSNRRRARSLYVIQRVQRVVYVTARITLGFFAAAQVYIALEGPLPLSSALWDAQMGFTLLVYTLVYITVYLAVFVLELYATRRNFRDIINTNLLLIAVTMLLPVPFALLSAETSDGILRPSEWVAVLGLGVVVIGLHALSRSDVRLRRQVDELRTLSVVTRAMRSHLDLDVLLKTIYSQVSELFAVNNFIVALHGQEEDKLVFPLVIRHGQEQTAQPVDAKANSLINYVVENGVPLLISHDVSSTAAEMQLRAPDEAIVSWMGIPLSAGDREIGVMVLISYDPNRHFEQTDLRLLNIMASSASVIIENAQLYNQQTTRVDQLKALNAITALLSGTLSPDTVLDTVISSASAIDQSDAVAVYLYGDGGLGELQLVRYAGLSAAFIEDPPLPELYQQPAERTTPLMPLAIADVGQHLKTGQLRLLHHREKKQAYVELPLLIGEQSIGVLVLYYDHVQNFDSERLELLRTFTTQASQAISNARIYTTTDEALQRSVDRMLALANIGRALTSTVELRTVSDLILSSAIEATPAIAGSVALHEQDGRALRVIAQHGDLINSHEDLVDISLPISRSKEPLGVITLRSEPDRQLTNSDRQFVGQIADQAVIAIENARLFERITEGRDRLQIIIDTMDEGLILIDAAGMITLANFRVDLIGLSIDNIQGQSVLDLLDDEEMDLAGHLGFNSARDLASLIQDLSIPGKWKSRAPHTYVLQDEQNTLYIQRYIIPVPDEIGETMGALMVFYNKTEEHELNRAREEFSRMIVHDLRSPLTAVTTSMKLLRQLVPKDSDFYALVETTTDSSRRAIRKLLSRVDDILDVSRMETGKLSIDPDITELATLADSVCVELSPLAHELRIDIVSEVDTALPFIKVDADKVERVLINLVDNALKYSPPDKKVIIRAYEPGNSDVPDGFVQIEVVDSGPGIPDEYKERLFDRYTQVEGRKKVRRGVGLGLTFCKLVAEAHGGHIWISDNPTGGSIFSFTVPIAKITPLPEDEPSLTGD